MSIEIFRLWFKISSSIQFRLIITTVSFPSCINFFLLFTPHIQFVMMISLCFARWKLPTEVLGLLTTKKAVTEQILSQLNFNQIILFLSWCWLYPKNRWAYELRGKTQLSSFSTPHNCTKWWMALGSDSSKMVLVLMDMPFCGRPRKPRPLISVILSAFVVHMFDVWFLILET